MLKHLNAYQNQLASLWFQSRVYILKDSTRGDLKLAVFIMIADHV